MYPDTMNQLSPRQRDAVVEAAFDCTTEVFAGIEKIGSRRPAIDDLPFPDPLKSLHFDGADMRIFSQVVLAERNGERFGIGVQLMVSDDIRGVLDGVGRDDLFVVVLGVGIAEVPFEKGFDVEFFGNVDAISLDFLEDTDPCFPIAVRLEFHI